MLIDYGKPPTSSISDLGEVIPSWVKHQLYEELDRRVERATKKIRRNWEGFASEPGMVGALINDLDFAIDVEGWSVSVHGQEFSSIVKEPIIGADLGVIVDIVHGSKRTAKSLWFQAKRLQGEPPRSPQALQGRR